MEKGPLNVVRGFEARMIICFVFLEEGRKGKKYAV